MWKCLDHTTKATVSNKVVIFQNSQLYNQMFLDLAESPGPELSSEPPLCSSDTDSLSQGSSVGSLGLEDDDDRNSLKNHFDTLASSQSEGKPDLLPVTLPTSVTWPSWPPFPLRAVWDRPADAAASWGDALPEPETQHLHPLPVPLPRPSQVRIPTTSGLDPDPDLMLCSRHQPQCVLMALSWQWRHASLL